MLDPEKKKQEYIELFSGKKLCKAEMQSIIKNISSFNDFGNDAETYISSISPCPSLIYQFAIALDKLGMISFFRVRESARYTNMLYLTLQQKWNHGLGDIIKCTSFIDCHKIKNDKKVYNIVNPFEYAISYLKQKRDYYTMAAMIKASDNENNIAWCSFYISGDKVLIGTYLKPGQTYVCNRLYGYIPSKVDIVFEVKQGKKPVKKRKKDHEIQKEVYETNLNTELENSFDPLYDEDIYNAKLLHEGIY